MLSKFRHPSLVILMGFACNGSQRLLVYEYLAGGDVSRRLQKCARDSHPFSHQQRLSCALDAACGLSHLHNSSPKVFHRDIKTANILLDRNGGAKMADFGLACLSRSTEHKVKQASGTIGYACPYYIQRGVVTEGSEVYSFGMVMIESLAAGTPVVGLDSGAISEIVKDGHTGLVVSLKKQHVGKNEVVDEHSTVQSLAKALEKVETINRKDCRSDFEARFTRERMVNDHIAAYKKLVK